MDYSHNQEPTKIFKHIQYIPIFRSRLTMQVKVFLAMNYHDWTQLPAQNMCKKFYFQCYETVTDINCGLDLTFINGKRMSMFKGQQR